MSTIFTHPSSFEPIGFMTLLVFTVFVQLAAVPLTGFAMKLLHKNKHAAMELEVLLMLLLVLQMISEAVEITLLATLAFIVGALGLAGLTKVMPMNKGGLTMMQKTGVMLLFAVSLHEFVEGAGFGSTYTLSTTSGLVSALLIAAHNIPEASIVALVYMIEGGGTMKALKAVTLTQVFYVLGAVLVAALSFNMHVEQQALIVAFSAGTIMYISIQEVLLMRKM